MAVGVEIPKESGSDSAHLGMAPSLQHWGALPGPAMVFEQCQQAVPGQGFWD